MSWSFGTAGVPRSATGRSTIAGLAKLNELGLDCLEIEFVHRVSIGEEMASLVREEASVRKIRLSVHAPYYINLNSRDKEKRIASRARLILAAHIGSLCGATDVVFHPGFYQGDPPDETFEEIKRELKMVLGELDERGISLHLRPETTGKASQFGSLEETLRLCAELSGLKPCLDFSHLHARKPYQSKRDFLAHLDDVRRRLGESALKELHLHISGIFYSKKGERMHINLGESDFPYRFLIQALCERETAGRLICESPNLEEDALMLKEALASS